MIAFVCLLSLIFILFSSPLKAEEFSKIYHLDEITVAEEKVREGYEDDKGRIDMAK